jgi:hypothetical protein
MPRYAGRTDRTNRVLIEPEITRAYWSKRRAWNGAAVQLVVETRHVRDDTALALEVWEDDSNEGNPDDRIAAVDGDHRVRNNRCVVDYTLRWDAAALGREAASEQGTLEFYFRVAIADFELTARSNLLLVDVAGFTFSS